LAESLEESEAEADRDGYFTLEEVMAEMNAIIEVEAEPARRRARCLRSPHTPGAARLLLAVARSPGIARDPPRADFNAC
jgi:hypothetical protein